MRLNALISLLLSSAVVFGVVTANSVVSNNQLDKEVSIMIKRVSWACPILLFEIKQGASNSFFLLIPKSYVSILFHLFPLTTHIRL